MDTLAQDTRILFGGERGWSPGDWTASDDRVRGGASQSYLSCAQGDTVAKFYGHLDIDTLGGAGFASQRTASDELSIDLSDYNGIQLLIAGADSKEYTFILKDSLLPRGDDGREQANVSYEYNFTAPLPFGADQPLLIRVPFSNFKPTYRGRTKEDAKPLDKKNIKRFSFMVRSFFGTQHGDFQFAIAGLSAYKGREDVWRDWDPSKTAKRHKTTENNTGGDAFPYPYKDLPAYEKPSSTNEKPTWQSERDIQNGWCWRLCE